MLDIKFIRENVDKVKEAVKNKRINLDVDQLLDLDARRRSLLTELESLQATKNQVSREVPKLQGEEKQTGEKHNLFHVCILLFYLKID